MAHTSCRGLDGEPVLPRPPGPTSVTRRRCSSRSPIWATALTRPTKLDTGSGKLFGCSPIVFSGGIPARGLRRGPGRGGPVRARPQLVEAQVDELDVVRQRARPHDGLGHHDLATVGGGHDAGAAVGRWSEVVAVAGHDRYPAVQPDPDAEGLPLLGGPDQRALCGDGGGDGIGRDVEAGEQPVAGELDHGAAVHGDGLAQDAVVEVHRRRHGVGVLLPLPRAGLDVGEHEGQLGADVGHQPPPNSAAKSGVVGADTTVCDRATTDCDRAVTQGIRVMRPVAP